MSSPVLTMNGVVRQHGKRRVLGPISLTLRPGECIAVTGSNGAGKSTLIRIASGQETPDEGTVDVLSRPPAEFDLAFRRDVFVLDEAAFYPDLTVREHLELVAVGHSRSRHVESLVIDALERCRLRGHADLTPGLLSKGLQQLMLLAVLLVRPRPRLLILDEPEKHLDAAARESLTELLAERKATGAAVLLATHHDPLAERVADVWLRLANGVPMAAGEPKGRP